MIIESTLRNGRRGRVKVEWSAGEMAEFRRNHAKVAPPYVEGDVVEIAGTSYRMWDTPSEPTIYRGAEGLFPEGLPGVEVGTWVWNLILEPVEG